MAVETELKDLGNGLWAWIQGDGSWGWSNAGLITAGGEAALVDTLFDEQLTDTMLRAMEASCGIRRQGIDTVVNTHANGDHTHGNALLEHAEIVASEASAREMEAFTPATLAQLKAAGSAGALGEAGRYFAEIFAPFDFAGVRHRPPTRTFSGAAALDVGDLRVELLEVGPAHTAGDVLVHVPDASTVFTGDILFIQGTPIVWAGPLSNWVAACELIEHLDPAHIVPGHGPMTDLSGVREVADYLRHVEAESVARFEAGMGAEEAALDLAASGGMARYAGWRDAERIAVNVDTAWRHWSGSETAPDALALFGRMARLYFDRR
ncbi:MBL fold metallo-hydrolase [Sandaracinobacter sp. RS1-74]|uniref:MBL fold metallo-hydrolase n=1 Tax=Sandaracinobacteroides sayramensis TaxID=2913411 RepID=UPI001EDAE73F|nr:MBL fold metallo-hydrolase [Sandaracinobacteroides sayramensis]MCG2840725.1 MBL fold metallo-hydrolase [Sandaracinobacteroides sayramensis]